MNIKESDTQCSKKASKKKPTMARKLFEISGIIVAILILIALVVLTRFREIFPTTMLPFDLNDPSISHLEKPYTIKGSTNVAACAVVVFICTILWFVLEGKLIRKNLQSILLTVYFTILGACFMIILVNSLKNLAGNLRPYFMDACKPNQTMVEELKARNTSWVDENMTKTICTSEGLKLRRSFPSGHSAEAWYAMTLSILFLQYTKRITGNSSQSFSLTNRTGLLLPIKAILQFILFAFASWIGVTRTLDYHHFWWDVLAGSLFGVLIAVVMFYWFVKPVMESAEDPEEEGGKCGKKGAHFKVSQKYCCCRVRGDTQTVDVELEPNSNSEGVPSDGQASPLLDEPQQPDKHSASVEEDKLHEDVKLV